MDFKQLLMLVGAVLVLVVIAVLAIQFAPKGILPFGEKNAVDASYVESLEMKMDPKAIPELKEIIKGNHDSYTRERAVIALADLSAFSGNEEDAISFLKDVASNETDEDVRVAAFSSIDALRQRVPADIGGRFDLRAYGDFKPNSTIQFVAEVSSYSGCDDVIVLLDNLWTVNGNETLMETFNVSPTKPYYISLAPGEKRTLDFNLTVPGSGEYIVNFRMKMGQDRFDYKVFRKDVSLSVSESGGSYTVANSD